MVLDILCILLIAGGGFLGWLKGLFRMVARLVGIIVAFLISCSIVSSVCVFMYDNLVAPQIGKIIGSKIEELGADETVSQIYNIISDIQTKVNLDSQIGSALESTGITASDIEQNISSVVPSNEMLSSVKQSYDELAKFISGVSPSVLSFIADKIDLSQLEELSKSMYSGDTIILGSDTIDADEAASARVATGLVNILRVPFISFFTPICFTIMFILLSVGCMLIFGFVGKLLSKIKIVELASHIGGAAVGVICGLGIALLIPCICSFAITPDNDLYQYIDKSIAIQVSGSFTDFLASVEAGDILPEIAPEGTSESNITARR